jgi:hypothetical protein
LAVGSWQLAVGSWQLAELYIIDRYLNYIIR